MILRRNRQTDNEGVEVGFGNLGSVYKYIARQRNNVKVFLGREGGGELSDSQVPLGSSIWTVLMYVAFLPINE